jgi:hypothetical protein
VWAFSNWRNALTTSLNQAVALYRGDLLPEIYDDWVLPQRVELHEQFRLSWSGWGGPPRNVRITTRP